MISIFADVIDNDDFDGNSKIKGCEAYNLSVISAQYGAAAIS